MGERSYLLAGSLAGLRVGGADDLACIKSEDTRACVGDLRVHEGNLGIDGDFDASGESLLVRGNLVVRGTLGLDETGTLVVTGDLEAENVALEGNLEIQGDTRVTGTIFGFYEGGVSHFMGAMRARLLLIGNHALEYEEDNLEVAHHLSFRNFQELDEAGTAMAKRVLSGEAYAQLGSLIGATSEEDGPSTDGLSKLLREKGFLR